MKMSPSQKKVKVDVFSEKTLRECVSLISM
jgi:hypothetical protein